MNEYFNKGEESIFEIKQLINNELSKIIKTEEAQTRAPALLEPHARQSSAPSRPPDSNTYPTFSRPAPAPATATAKGAALTTRKSAGINKGIQRRRRELAEHQDPRHGAWSQHAPATPRQVAADATATAWRRPRPAACQAHLR